jgi:hypothetical protein
MVQLTLQVPIEIAKLKRYVILLKEAVYHPKLKLTNAAPTQLLTTRSKYKADMTAPEPNDDFKAPEVNVQNAASRTDRWLLALAEQRAHTGLKLIKNIWLRCSQYNGYLG